MATRGIDLSHEDYLSDLGKRNDEILRARLGADVDVAAIALAKEEAYRLSIRTRGLDVLPGARAWLARLRDEGWRQALATSAPRANIAAVFAAVEIESLFDAVASAEDVAHGKPHPDVFLAAAKKLDVAPERCLVIEDAPAGVEAAHRAGMRALGVRTTVATLEADWVIATLADLPPNFFDALT
jgi:beta-phosphoglucomutase